MSTLGTNACLSFFLFLFVYKNTTHSSFSSFKGHSFQMTTASYYCENLARNNPHPPSAQSSTSCFAARVASNQKSSLLIIFFYFLVLYKNLRWSFILCLTDFSYFLRLSHMLLSTKQFKNQIHFFCFFNKLWNFWIF